MSEVWNGAQVLVTGARGFIASRLTPRLLAAGASVYGVSAQRDPSGVAPNVNWLSADLADRAAAQRVFEQVRPDFVFHLGGYVTGAQKLENVGPTFSANLVSTVTVLSEAAARSGCRVLLAGSMQEPDPADPAAVPCSPYAASKWACTAYARMFHGLYGLPVTIVRPMMVYGPGQWDTTKLLPYVVTSLISGTSPVLGSGVRQLDWVYVDDVVEGMLRIAQLPSTSGRALDLGSGVLTSVREIAERVAAILGTEVPLQFGVRPDRILEQPRVAATSDTLRETGWIATTSLEEGLSRTVTWYRRESAPNQ